MNRDFKTKNGEVLNFKYRNKQLIQLENLTELPLHEIFKKLAFRGVQAKLVQVALSITEDEVYGLLDENPEILAFAIQVFTKDVSATLKADDDESGNVKA